MIGRIVPYSEVFISVTFELDEAAAISDLLGSLRASKDAATQKAVKELGTVLEEQLERAAAYKTRRGL